MPRQPRRCKGCGGPIPTQPRKRGKYCSIECATAAVIRANVELHNRQGPAYDHWRESMRAAADRLNP